MLQQRTSKTTTYRVSLAATFRATEWGKKDMQVRAVEEDVVVAVVVDSDGVGAAVFVGVLIVHYCSCCCYRKSCCSKRVRRHLLLKWWAFVSGDCLKLSIYFQNRNYRVPNGHPGGGHSFRWLQWGPVLRCDNMCDTA